MHKYLSHGLLVSLLYSGALFSTYEEKKQTRLEQAYTFVKMASVTTLTVAALIIGVKCYKFVSNSSATLDTIRTTLTSASASLAHIDTTAQQATATLAAAGPALDALNASIAQADAAIRAAGVTMQKVDQAAGNIQSLTDRANTAFQTKPFLRAVGSKQGQLAMVALFSAFFKGFNTAQAQQPVTPSWTNPRDVLPALTQNPGVFRAFFAAWAQTRKAAQQPATTRRFCAIQ